MSFSTQPSQGPPPLPSSLAQSYTPPEWAGPPSSDLSFEVIRNGAELPSVNLSEMATKIFQSENRNFLVAGRQPTCDIQNEHPSVSREHIVVLFHQHTSQVFIYDLGSAHGTTVNRKRIPVRELLELRVGDTMVLGASSRMYVLAGPEELRPAEAEFISMKSAMAAKLEKAMAKKSLVKQIKNTAAIAEAKAASLRAQLQGGIDDSMALEELVSRSDEEYRSFKGWVNYHLDEELFPDAPRFPRNTALLKGWGQTHDEDGPVVVDESGHAVNRSELSTSSASSSLSSKDKVHEMTEKQHNLALKLRTLQGRITNLQREVDKYSQAVAEDIGSSAQMEKGRKAAERLIEAESAFEDACEALYQSYRDSRGLPRRDERRGRRRHPGESSSDDDDDDRFYDRVKAAKKQAAIQAKNVQRRSGGNDDASSANSGVSAILSETMAGKYITLVCSHDESPDAVQM